MATKRWYLVNGVDANGWQALSETAQAAATCNAGWVVGTGSTFSSELQANAERASTTFVANTVPDGSLDTSLKDAFRTPLLNGSFANANWAFQFTVQGTVQSGAADGQIVFRLIKANADGSSATEITSAQQSASVITNVTSSDLSGTLTFNPGAITLTNQYLFIQIAWKRTGAGGMTTTNVRLRTGVNTTTGTSILSADFTPADQAVTNVFIASTAVLNAAWVSTDILVAGSIGSASARGGRAVVFPSELIGYVFYCNSAGVFGYSKTTDGGLTWGAHTAVDGAGATTVVAFDIWFDQWTPGDQGTLIHTWWFDSTNNTVRWRTLNITGDALGTVRTVFAGASAVAGRGAFVSGTKTRSGYLYCAYDIDAGTERGLHRSTDSGTTWSTNLSTTFVEATLDTCKLFPASGTGDNNDCWALYYDASALALTLKLWDSSAVAQVESATIGVAHTDGPTDLTGQFGYDGAVRHTDGHLIVVALSGRDVAASQHQVFDITDTSTITTKTAIAASTDDHYYPQVFINQGTGTIFVAYNGKRDGSEVLDTATKVYYTYSLDGGTTWAAGDAAYQEGAAVAVQQLWTAMSGSRFYSVWRVGTQLWGNKANSLVQLGVQFSSTITSTAVLYTPTVNNTQLITGSTIASTVVFAPTVALALQLITGATIASTTTLYAITVNVAGSGPTVRTIGTSSRDYSTLQAWEDACPADLVTTDQVWKGECYNDSEFFASSGTLLTISGITSDSTHYPWLTAASGQSFQDHSTVRSNPQRYDQSKGVGLRTNTGSQYSGSCITSSVHHTTITRLQIQSTTNDCIDLDPYIVHVDNCLLSTLGNSTWTACVQWANTGSTIYNTVCFKRSNGPVITAYVSPTIIGCTLVLDPSVTSTTKAVQTNSGGVMQNTLIVGWNTPTSGTWTGSNNAWTGAAATATLPGTDNIYDVPATVVRNRTTASLDCRSVGGMLGTAQDLLVGLYEGTNSTNDISAKPRMNPPTIGAWEPFTVSTIGTSSRQYSTLQAWEDAAPASLVTADQIWRGECYNDSGFTAGLTIAGITCDATHYVELTAAAGQSFQDHANVRTNALTYNPANGVAIVANVLYGRVIYTNVGYQRISRLQIRNTSTNGGCFEDANGLGVMRDLIFDSTGACVNDGAALGNTFINCVGTQRAGSGNGFLTGNADQYYGCVVIHPSDVGAGGNAFHVGFAYGFNRIAQSCAAFGFTNFSDNVTSVRWDTTNSKNNATDAAAAPGSSNQVSVTYSQTTPFTDADKDSLDLRAITGTALIDNGFLNTSLAPNDISGFARDSSPTIGGWEFGVAGPSDVTVLAATIASTAVLFVPTAALATGDQPVTAVHRASTAVLYTPTVTLNLTVGMTGHWPMDESSGNALDAHGSNPLTQVGGTIGTTTIEGTPARDLEATNLQAFIHATNSDFDVSSGNFTFAIRFQFESVATAVLLTKDQKIISVSTLQDYIAYYQTSTYAWIWDDGSFTYEVDAFPGTPSTGVPYYLFFGRDAAGKNWIRWGNSARTTGGSVSSPRETAGSTFCVGAQWGGNGGVGLDSPFDGAIGPVSFWKRALSDAELDQWKTAKGEYVAIGGSPPARSITTVAIASTLVVYTPAVYPAQNLTANLIGHWPMNESTYTDALDQHGTNPLTAVGTAPSPAQDPIDGVPARALEGKANGNALTHGDNADLSFSNDQAFTWILRTKFESITPAGFDFLIGKADPAFSEVDFFLWWSGGFGFQTNIFDSTGNQSQTTDVGPGGEYQSSLVLGKTYVIATGYDPVANKLWIRVNNNPRVESTWTTGTRDSAGATTLFVGAWALSADASNFDGAIGPVSFFKRSLTDAEIDYWIGVKGDYAKIGGGAAPQSVTTTAIASTVVLYTPGVFPFQNLMPIVGHWPMDESTYTDALDAYGNRNPLTAAGTAPSPVQDPIDGVPARALEGKTAGNALTHADNADLSFSNDQAFTWITRVKFESVTPAGFDYLIAKANATFTISDFVLMWSGYLGFAAILFDAAGGGANPVDPGPGNEYKDAVVFGKTYVVAAGHDPVANKVWIRVNNNPRVEFPWTTGTRDDPGATTLSVGLAEVDSGFDGAMGPASFFKRSLTDAEIDYWIGIKGDFAKMGGGSDQSILAATIAPTTVLNVLSVAPGAVTITGVHRATTLSVNVPTVVAGPVAVTTGTVTTTAILRVPSVATGPVTIAGATIPSTIQVFVPSVTVGAVTVTAGTIAAGNQRFVPTVAHFVSGATIASGNQRFAPTVALTLTTGTITTTVQTFAATVGLTVTTGTVPSFSVMYFPTITTGPVTVTGAFITSVVVASAPSVTTGAVFISGVHIPTTMQAFAPSVAVGPVTVTTPALASTAQLFTPTLTAIAAGSIGAATITTTAVTNQPSVVGGLAIIGAQTIASTIVVRAPTVAAGPVTLLGVTIASTGQSFAPSLAVGPVTVTGATIAATTQLFAPSLTSAITTAFIGSAGQRFTPTVLTLSGVVGQTLASTLQMFAPTLTTGAVTVVGSTRVSALMLFEPSVGVGVTTISGGTRVAAAVLYPPEFVSTLNGTFIISTAQMFAPTVRITQFVSGAVIPAGNALFVPSLLPTTPVSGGTRVSALLLFAPSITTGPVTIIGSTVPATTLAFTPSLGAGAVTVALPHLASALVLRAPSIAVTVVTPPWATTTQSFAPSLTTGPVAVQTAPRTSTLQMFAPTLGAGVTTAFIASTSLPHAPTLIPLVTTPLWATTTELFPPGAATLGEMFAQHIPSTTRVFPPQMVAYAAPPEILDFESNIVTAIGGTVNLCSSVDGTVILTRGVAMSVEVERVVDMSPSVVRRDFEVGVER